MTPESISSTLAQLFANSVAPIAPGSWQVETAEFRLLVLLSDDQSWLRMLIPIVPAQDAEPFVEQLMAANFDSTQTARYALHQGVLWGVFQHSRAGLTSDDFAEAVQQLIQMRKTGLNDCFNQLIESRIRQIILAAKQQGQSLEATMQTLDRFYEEGLMGGIDTSAADRQETLAAWRRQLDRLWSEEEA